MVAHWSRLGSVFIVVGFEIFLFALSTTDSFRTLEAETLLITSFLLYLAAFVLMLFIHFGGFESSKYPYIAVTVLSFGSGLLILVAVIVYATQNGTTLPIYSTTLFICGALLSILGGTISLLYMFGKVGGID